MKNMKTSVLLLINVLLASSALAQPDMTARRDAILSFFRSISDEHTFASVLALAENRHDTTRAWEMLASMTSTGITDIVERFRMTATYARLHNAMPDTLKQRIEQIWATQPMRPGNSEHEALARHTATLLTTTLFPTGAVWHTGKTREESEREALIFIDRWIRETSELGQREFDSPTYGPIFLASMLLIRDYVPDSTLRYRAELMAHWLLADFAHEHLNGAWAGAHSRENMFSAMHPVSSEMSAISWLYFGDGPEVYAREQVIAALSDFLPLPEIVEIAIERSAAFEAWESKRTAKVIRDNGYATEGRVVKYTYMDPLYAIGSIPGGLIQPREQHSWDVTWISEDADKPGTLFLMQPFSDPPALTPFLPHSEELVLRTTSNIDPYYATVTKTVGGSPFEDVFQYRNTLIALYDIEDISKFPVVTGFIPPGLKDMDVDTSRSGWITINTGDVYIALYPLQHFRLTTGDLGTQFLSFEKRNGAIVQVSGRNAVGAYRSFVKRIRESRIDRSRFDSDNSIQYVTIFGDTLSMTFGGKRTVNGSDFLPPSENMLFSSPKLQSDIASGMLRIMGKAGDVIIDMKRNEIRRTE